jgi:hypothetical protein
VAVDLAQKVIVLKDERYSRIAKLRAARTTKSGRDRIFPIHEHLLNLLIGKAKVRKTGNVFPAAKGGVLRARNVLHLLIENVINPLSERFHSPQDEIGFKDGRLHSFDTFSVQNVRTVACRNRW